MTFNVGQQVGGVVNNVGGNQVVVGSQSGRGEMLAVDLEGARSAVGELQRLLISASTQLAGAPGLASNVDDLATEFAKPNPDKPSIAERVKRLIPALISAGSVIGASKQILSALQTIVQWLGPVGSGLMSMLPTVL
jgi:hypothetical protein